TRDVTGYRRVVGLAGDLVDLVDVDNTPLGLFHLVIAFLKQLLDDVLDILTHVARFSQRGRISDGERHIQQPRQGFRQQGLARTGRTDDQDITLAQFNIVLAFALVQTLVVVVYRNRQHLLGLLLANHVLVEDGADLHWRRQFLLTIVVLAFLHFLANDVVAQIDTLDRKSTRLNSSHVKISYA